MPLECLNKLFQDRDKTLHILLQFSIHIIFHNLTYFCYQSLPFLQFPSHMHILNSTVIVFDDPIIH